MAFLVAVISAVLSLAFIFFVLEKFGLPESKRRTTISVIVMGAYASIFWIQPSSYLISNVFILAASPAAAFLLAGFIRGKSAIVAAAIAVALADIISYSFGLTRFVLDTYQAGENNLLQYLAIILKVGSVKMAVIGIGDLVVAGAFFQALCRIGYSPLVTGVVLTSAIVIALIIGWIFGGIPALPFLGAGVLIYLRPWSTTALNKQH